MITGFLLDHLALGGTAVVAVAVFVGVGLLGGWALVLNRYGIGALALVLVGCAAGSWWVSEKAKWVAQGAAEKDAEWRVAVTKARDARRAEISEYVAGSAARETDLRAKLATAEGHITQQGENREKTLVVRVTDAAVARCVIPLGFVREHNAAVPAAAGRPDVPAVAGAEDAAVAATLRDVARVVGGNYDRCAQLQAEYDAERSRRYAACLDWDRRFRTVSGCAP